MKAVEIEKLLQWAYRDELSKGGEQPFSQKWEAIYRLAELGTKIDDQLGPVMKLPPIFGEPHPDALIIARHVSQLAHPANALVTMYANWGRRPDWLPGPVRVSGIFRGSKAEIVGECRGRNRYTTGSYCPLRFTPSMKDIADARLEYRRWYDGLSCLVVRLGGALGDHRALPPIAPPEPWILDGPKRRILRSLTSGGKSLTSFRLSRIGKEDEPPQQMAGAFAF